ncbi:UNVERIFIED_CONTAM: hypothetical protein PYX00_004484 [Menopon gallinae]|uniref:Tigger transposable element-derived protein 4 n=1 Tax=Menopon gallinae TaxID=328185 RepID=A0AAW2I3Z9_9NEOP
MNTVTAEKRGAYKTLSLESKVRLIQKSESGTKRKCDIAKEFGIQPNTLSTILRNKEKILKAWTYNEVCASRKRLREPRFGELEECTLRWFKQARDNNIPVSGPVLLNKAEEFSKMLKIENFKGSIGWLNRFKERHGLSFKKVYGESASLSENDYEGWKIKLASLTSKYDPSNIFNIDETALFYRCTPDKAINLKGETCTDGRLSKERITVLLGASMDGSEKLPAIVIGKYSKPRCFSRVNSLPVEYFHSKNSWVTCDVFERLLINLDEHFSRQKREILLFVDNCTAHNRVPRLESIKVVFFPANVTSEFQPMEQGVIHDFKRHYRNQVLQHVTEQTGERKEIKPIKLIEAVRMIRLSWSQVQPQTIKNCFMKSGFYTELDENCLEDCFLNEDPEEWKHVASDVSYNEYVHIDDDVATCGKLDVKDIVSEVKTSQEQLLTDDESESDGEATAPPSSTEAHNSILVLQQYFENQEFTPSEAFDYINVLKVMINLHRKKDQV